MTNNSFTRAYTTCTISLNQMKCKMEKITYGTYCTFFSFERAGNRCVLFDTVCLIFIRQPSTNGIKCIIIGLKLDIDRGFMRYGNVLGKY